MRLIDADLFEAVTTIIPDGMDAESYMAGMDFVLNKIDDAPTIEPERKKGEWMPQDHNKRSGYVTTTVYYYPKCSVCGHHGNYGMYFCPNCGADMRGDSDG